MAQPWPSTPGGLRVAFTLDRREFFQAIYQTTKCDPIFWRATALSLVGLILGTFGGLMGVGLASWVLITVDCAVLALLAYCCIVLPIQSWRLLESNREHQFYEFSPDGVFEQLADHTAFVKWSVFSRVIETRDFYCFLVRGRRAIFIPKRAFENSRDQDQYRGLVKGRAPHRFKESAPSRTS